MSATATYPVWQQAGHHILFDPALLPRPEADHFDPAWWQSQERVEGRALGRGTTWFLRAEPPGWVLRHYRRGGLVGRVLDDGYAWLGLQATRAWREWQLLYELHALGLPVPRPVAAHVHRRGLFYTADLITERIPNTRPLSALLLERALDPGAWSTLGRTLARFDRAGAGHADLNAHNILCGGGDGEFHVIDFDRGHRHASAAAQARARARLLRSLHKCARLAQGRFHFTPADWQALNAGYRDS